MALKYYFEFTDTENILHRCNISSDSFVGSSTEVNGSVVFDYAETEDALESIRGCGLRIDLEASLDSLFDDLYSERERTYSVEYIRDSVTVFNGWLSPEGLYESFVQDHWIVSLDCLDGLGFLKNLSYVDENGFYFVGKQKQLDIIVNCLKRTEVLQNINTSINIFYEGLSGVDILDNVYLNPERFIKDDGETIMNCEEVLRSVLEPYTACITQMDGEWYIFKPNELARSSSVTFYRYDSDGVALTPATQTIDVSQVLGSQINNRYPYHCNANQQLSTKNSIGAFRINYKYGLVKSLLDNTYLVTTDGIIIDDFTVNSTTNMTLPTPSGQGVTFDIVTTGNGVLNLTSDNYNVTLNATIDFTIKHDPNTVPQTGGVFIFQIILTDGTDSYYLNNSNEWILNVSATELREVFAQGNQIISISTPVTPIAGDISLLIYTPETSIPGFQTFLKEITISPGQDSLTTTNKIGEFHTVERTANPSAKVPNNKEVFNGDNLSDIYVGTIYKTNQTDPTSVWYRTGFTESKPILQIMGEETLRISEKPARIFSGDIYGFINYLSTVTIDTITGVFVPISYSYDAKNNVTSLKLAQIFPDDPADPLSDVRYTLTFDYGNTVKPTIVG